MVSIEIKRSPAKVCWHLVCNNVVIDTADTKDLAKQERAELLRKVGA